MVGTSKNEEMMAGYELSFCRDTERKRKKRHRLAFVEMRNRPIDESQKLKKMGTKTETVCVGWQEKKSSRKSLSLGFITRLFQGKCTGGLDNDSVRY